MNMNEILLILAVLAMWTVSYFFMKNIKQPLKTYIKLSAGLLLLILVWFFAKESSLPIKILMSAIVISSAIKTRKDYTDN